MSTTVKNCAFQRAPGGEEQGSDQGVWQVLSWDEETVEFIVSRCMYACWNE